MTWPPTWPSCASSPLVPELLDLPGVGPVVAGTILLAWSHPGRVRSEAAFAALAGTAMSTPSSAPIHHASDDAPAPRGRPRWPWTTWIVGFVALACLYVIVRAAIVVITTPYPLSPWESAIVLDAWRMVVPKRVAAMYAEPG